ncbi:unnamed protein product, partial [Didymodactylos carnosus]
IRLFIWKLDDTFSRKAIQEQPQQQVSSSSPPPACIKGPEDQNPTDSVKKNDFMISYCHQNKDLYFNAACQELVWNIEHFIHPDGHRIPVLPKLSVDKSQQSATIVLPEHLAPRKIQIYTTLNIVTSKRSMEPTTIESSPQLSNTKSPTDSDDTTKT